MRLQFDCNVLEFAAFYTLRFRIWTYNSYDVCYSLNVRVCHVAKTVLVEVKQQQQQKQQQQAPGEGLVH